MPNAKQLADDLMASWRGTAEEMTQWFSRQMPQVYFQDTDHDTQLTHLRAMIAAKASGRPVDLKLGRAEDNEVTYIQSDNKPGILAAVTKDLPPNWKLRSAKIHTSDDDKLVIVNFQAGDPARFDPKDPEQKKKLDATLEYASRELPKWAPDEVKDFFGRCTSDYLTSATPLRIAHHWRIFKTLTGTDGVHVEIEPEADGKQTRIIVAAGNAPNRMMLERIAVRLSRLKVNINRAYLDSVDDGQNGAINFLGFVVVGPDMRQIDTGSELAKRIRKDLKRLRWFDNRTLEVLERNHDINPVRAEVGVALCDLVYQALVKHDAKNETKVFGRDRIGAVATANNEITESLAELLLMRFDPDEKARIADAAFEKRIGEIKKKIESAVAGSPDYHAEHARTILSKMLEAVCSVLRTNVYVEDRYALSMRLDPAVMAGPDRPNTPYGVYFVHGCEFNGFHVRFRDIARGGVRAVFPPTRERHLLEMSRLYDECYGLASAQQLKNKDIPEGGAKAVILVEPDGNIARAFKAFGDAILDLITNEETTKARVVDRLGRQELLYLGPDENITPGMIEWIVERAKRRGYSVPTALMSSKPGAGINHKVYGVTSEGITVFLETALKHCGIDPRKQPFTIKITGGPDGDVAGNEIRILDRNYGKNAKIVAIGDGTGVAEDPDGLDHAELLRLFREAKGIASFDKKKVGPKGRVVSVSEPDGERLRNTVHNRVVTDVFVPGGGRPNTIHDGNWRDFLKPDGKPSSPVIVEGANLFLTDGAREELTKLGCFIVKDSSANKCGVICSSFEIVACMLLDEREFMAIKEQYVAEVLVRLRELARVEAELLVRQHLHDPSEPLYKTSKKISLAIIKAADAFESVIDGLPKDVEPLLQRLVIEHLPPILVKTVGEKLWAKVPRAYLKWMMAKSLAARMVYREGYKDIESMPVEALKSLAVRYLRLEHERTELALKLEKSNLPESARVAQLLRSAGILSTLSE